MASETWRCGMYCVASMVGMSLDDAVGEGSRRQGQAITAGGVARAPGPGEGEGPRSRELRSGEGEACRRALAGTYPVPAGLPMLDVEASAEPTISRKSAAANDFR